MIEWSESQLMIRDAVRRFVESEIAPHVEELEHGDLPPYDILRKMYSAFGMDEMARAFRETNRSREVRQITQGRLAERRRHRSARGPGCGRPDSDHRIVSLLPGYGDGVRRECGSDRLRHPLEGNHRTKGALSARNTHPREDRCLGHHGAGFRLRRFRRNARFGEA